jgi:glycosyltransferase involved in cell wall biosynthesis
MSSVLILLERKPFGGAERATSLIIGLLANEGFNVTVLTGQKTVEKIKNVRWVYSPLLEVSSKLHLWAALFRPNLSRLRALINENDVVYIPRLAYPVIPLAKEYGKKVVVHLHDYQPMSYCAAAFPIAEKRYKNNVASDMKTSLRRELLEKEKASRAFSSVLATPLNKLCKIWLSDADVLVCVSRRQREIIESAMPEIASKLRVMYNPLPTQPFIEKNFSKQPTMLFLGGDSHLKGFNLFLHASYELLKDNDNLRFQLTRNFKDSRNEALIEHYNNRFNGAYKQLGQVEYTDVLKLHSVSEALLFPSIWEEPLPYAVVESMLSGTLPIASRVGGVPEIVRGTFAEKLLFNSGDLSEFLDRINLVLSLSKKNLIDTGCQLREAVLTRFSKETVGEELSQLFR